jgi:hypothetical protein
MKKTTPRARNENIVVQNLKGEVLLYDLKINRAYCLNETAAAVYRHCDGKTTFEELRRQSGENISDEVIRLAIEELNDLNLLAEKSFSRVSRRDLLQKAAFSAVALPLISMIAAPRAIHAASGGEQCTLDGQPTPNAQVVVTDPDTCQIDGVDDASCCSGVATGNYIDASGVCQVSTCGAGYGCANPGGRRDQTYLGTSSDPASCPSRANECCSNTTSFLTFISDSDGRTSYDCYCGTNPPL